MSACECGNQDHDDQAQFCSTCGGALGDRSGLLGVSRPKTLTTTTTAKSSAIDWRWLAAALVVTVGLIAWSAGSGGSGEESPTGEEAVSPDDPSTTTEPPSTAAPTTTMRPVTTAPTTTEATSADEDAQDPQATATVEPLGDGSPLFDEPIGFKLVSVTRGRLVIIDPDAATITTSREPKPSVEPIATIGEWLLVGNGQIGRLPLDSLTDEPTGFASDASSLSTISRPIGSDGTVWIEQYLPSAAGWPLFIRFDVASATELDRVELNDPPARITAFAPPVADRPLLIGVPAGGTYVHEGSGYRRVTEAHLITASADEVLVSRCGDELICLNQWLDRETWEPTSREAPPEPFDQVDVIEGTDWLVLTSFRENGSRMFNTTSGFVYDLRDRFIGTDWQDTLAISPDGRWMATRTGLLIEVANLETGEERMIEGVPIGARIIFTSADPAFGTE